MGKLHHFSLKAAVGKYAALHLEGKSEEEVKSEIAKDERDFDEEGVNEIYAEILEQNPVGTFATKKVEDSEKGDTSGNDSSSAGEDSAGNGSDSINPGETSLNPLHASLKDITDEEAEILAGKLQELRLKQDPEDEDKVKIYTVKSSFRDKNNWNIMYQEGQDVSHLDADRLKYLIEIGLVSEEEE